jgi:hypothetical protein
MFDRQFYLLSAAAKIRISRNHASLLDQGLTTSITSFIASRNTQQRRNRYHKQPPFSEA